MISLLRHRFSNLGKRLRQLSTGIELQRSRMSVLIFLHGYALAHTIRPLVIARALKRRGYPVVLAGRGCHVFRLRQEGFDVRDVETMPQDRMDQYVARGNYEYYDLEWIDRCVGSERTLIQMLHPALVIHEMKPTAGISARLEGVDDARVTQAYNQADYDDKIRLPDTFSTKSGPFDEYLAQHAAELKPQRGLNFFADIPEFHTPGGSSGSYYVGPLLDRPKEPQKLDILDEGWDTSLPLIYVTCGSSGRQIDYLDKLIEGFRGRPYRASVTTAGRWSPSTGTARGIPPANVRVVDFLPGEWILSRADLLTGVVGIGTIYQALSQGVPILGAPEHLDQEYHLNRVEALGLGIKLDRADFHADTIHNAIDRIVGELELYQRRCAAFIEPLRRYPDGSSVADLLDRHFLSRGRQYRVDGASLTPAGEFAHYIDVTTPSSLRPKRIREMIDRGMEKGLPFSRNGKGVLVDRRDAWNWLYDNEPDFFGSDYRALQRRRDRFLTDNGAGLRCRQKWQRFRVTYHYRLLPATSGSARLAPGERIKLFLPYPVTRVGHQQEVKLLSCAPAMLEASHVPSLGFFYGHVHEIQEGDKALDFSYTCELAVREQRIEEAGFKTELTDAGRVRHLEIDPHLARLPEVVKFRQQLDLPEDGSDERKARAIYMELAGSKRFVKTKDPNQRAHYSVSAILNSEGGHCVTLSRAFATLCRLEGIPTREVTGAFIGYPLADDEFQADNYCEPLFGHTWVEIHLAGKGWVPVEFHGIVIGEGAATERNVKDGKLRSALSENTGKYQDYYFGHLDNHRIICSESVRRMPQCLVEDVEKSADHPARWQPPSMDVRFECSLNVKCLQPAPVVTV